MKNMSQKHALLLTLLGLLLFIPTYVILTIQLNQGTYLQELSKLFGTMNIPGLQEFYRHHSPSPIMTLVDYGCILGYVALSVGFLMYYNAGHPIGRIIRGLNTGFMSVAILVGLIDVVETTIIAIGAVRNFDLPKVLFVIHIYGSYLKGLIWVVFLWEIVLLCVLSIEKIRRKKRL